MLEGYQKLLAKSSEIWFFSLGFFLSTVDLFKMSWGDGTMYFIVTCVVPSVMGRGSNLLGLNCSSVLEFCKGMGFKKRSFQCILLLFCFKRHQLLSSFGYVAGVCLWREIFYRPQCGLAVAHGLFVAFLDGSLF